VLGSLRLKLPPKISGSVFMPFASCQCYPQGEDFRILQTVGRELKKKASCLGEIIQSESPLNSGKIRSDPLRFRLLVKDRRPSPLRETVGWVFDLLEVDAFIS